MPDSPQSSPTATPDASAPVAIAQHSLHRDVVVQHYATKLGKSFQAKLLLAAIWGCANDPWTPEPVVFLSAARLVWVVADRANRSSLITRLVKIGALRKGKGSRSGNKYTLLRPQLHELSPALLAEVSAMGVRDYRFDVDAMKRGELAKPKSKSQKVPEGATPKVPRKDVTAHLKAMRLNWKKAARIIEVMAGLDKGAVSFKRGAKDVEALGAWLVHNHITVSYLRYFLRILGSPLPTKPTGDELRYVFEGDTLAKQAYLSDVLARLSKAAQARDSEEA